MKHKTETFSVFFVAANCLHCIKEINRFCAILIIGYLLKLFSYFIIAHCFKRDMESIQQVWQSYGFRMPVITVPWHGIESSQYIHGSMLLAIDSNSMSVESKPENPDQNFLSLSTCATNFHLDTRFSNLPISSWTNPKSNEFLHVFATNSSMGKVYLFLKPLHLFENANVFLRHQNPVWRSTCDLWRLAVFLEEWWLECSPLILGCAFIRSFLTGRGAVSSGILFGDAAIL